MKLFSVFLGGRAKKCNTELHDVVFTCGQSIKDTYYDLLDKWFGLPDRLHIDSWVEISIIDGKVKMRAGADAQIVQGLMGILTIAVNGSSCKDVMDLRPDFAEEMGILNSLTPSRSNGFRTMFDMIQNSVKVMM